LHCKTKADPGPWKVPAPALAVITSPGLRHRFFDSTTAVAGIGMSVQVKVLVVGGVVVEGVVVAGAVMGGAVVGDAVVGGAVVGGAVVAEPA